VQDLAELRRIFLINGGSWNAIAPYCDASRTPAQGSGLLGNMKRSMPAVVAPYGIPWKVLTPPETKPRTLRALVCTTGFATDVLVTGVSRLAANNPCVASESELTAEVLRKTRRVTVD
jgi:hypothetical protein